jgi:hypothetical protein
MITATYEGVAADAGWVVVDPGQVTVAPQVIPTQAKRRR